MDFKEAYNILKNVPDTLDKNENSAKKTALRALKYRIAGEPRLCSDGRSIYCPECLSTITENLRFCPNCGKSLLTKKGDRKDG